MLFVPPISDYKPFYVQFSGDTAIDLKDEYSVIVKTHDYPSSFKVKEPYKNNWKDEHGDDEYIPATGLKIEAFTFKMECAMFAKGSSESNAIGFLRAGMDAFVRALSAGSFSTYDEWTGFGFRDVRLVEFSSPQAEAYYVENNVARIIFTVVLKVNDPTTRMVLSDDEIIEL